MKKLLILPFYIDKKSQDDNYLVEGAIEELIDCISSFQQLRVLSRSISFYVNDNPSDFKELVHDLGVDFIIEGNVKRSSGEIKLGLRLVEASSNEVLSSRSTSFELKEWTKEVVKQTQLLLEDNKLIQNVPNTITVNRKAQELYLKGLYHWNRYTYDEMKIAIPYFKRAIKIDSKHALSYAGLANCYVVIATMGYEDARTAFNLALGFVKKALFLNNKHSESYLCAAFINLFYQYDYQQAKVNLEFALNLNKNNSKTHHILSFYYAFSRDFYAAEKHCLKAVSLDPLSIPQYAMLIRLNLYKKDFSNAQKCIDAAFAIKKDSLPIHQLQGMNYLFTETVESAIESFKYCLSISNEELLNYAYLSYAYSVCNFHAESLQAEQALEKTKVSKENGNYDLAKAIIFLGRKNHNDFFNYINKAVDKGLTIMFGDVLNSPMYYAIRNDDRYTKLLDRAKLNKRFVVRSAPQPTSIFEIKSNTKESLFIDPQDISFIQGDGNYCSIYYIRNSKNLKSVLRISLKQLEAQLNDFSYLLRCHKSYLVNLEKNVMLTGNSKSAFIESALFQIQIPVSRKKYSILKELLTTS